MASSVSHTAASVGLTSLAILVGLPTKGSLVDLTLGGSAEGHAIVLQLNDSSRSFSGHVVNGILAIMLWSVAFLLARQFSYLVSQPVRALDSVIHVPPPVIRLHVAKSSIDATLSCHCV